METLVAGITTFNITPMQVFEAIVVFLGIPFAAGFLTRYIGNRTKGEEWYDEELKDPDGQSLERVRDIRDEIEQRVIALFDKFDTSD